jgi:hypothetical protein
MAPAKETPDLSKLNLSPEVRISQSAVVLYEDIDHRAQIGHSHYLALSLDHKITPSAFLHFIQTTTVW